jgi:hypothetical protein
MGATIACKKLNVLQQSGGILHWQQVATVIRRAVILETLLNSDTRLYIQ